MLSRGRKLYAIPRTFAYSQNANIHTKFAVVGGGSAGMNVTAQLLTSGLASPSDITVFDPAKIHYYQPGFTMVSGGILGYDNNDVRKKLGGLIQKPMRQLFNADVNFVSDSIGEYEPDRNTLYTANSQTAYTYDVLLVCSGIELRYDLIEGLEDALQDPDSPVGSMYKLEYALKMNKLTTAFEGGKVIATQPPMPFKCGGAPQKWIYLTEHKLRMLGVKDAVESFKFYTHLSGMFGVKKYDKELRHLVKQKGITPMYQTELVKVEKEKKLAWFKDNVTNETFCDSYDILHVCPLQRPNKITASAAFSDPNGYVDVNKWTLQSNKYENIFGIGDASNCPNPKTAASIFAQTPTVINNIDRMLKKEPLIPSFDGYASCPIFIGDTKLLLAEFIYNGVPKETFGHVYIDQAQPRWPFYYLKRTLFPFAYWNIAPRGRWYGTTTIIKPSFKPVQGSFVSTPEKSIEELKANLK